MHHRFGEPSSRGKGNDAPVRVVPINQIGLSWAQAFHGCPTSRIIELTEARSQSERHMKPNRPKGQHYIPKMLLKHFCNGDGELWVGDKETGRVWRTRPCNVFKIRHLYTRHAFGEAAGAPASEDFRHEESLGRLESTVTPIIEGAIAQVRDRRCPLLSAEEDSALKEFMLAIARRTPESQKRLVAAQDFKDIYYQAAGTIAERQGYPLPEKKELYEDIEVLRHVDQFKRNVFARFAAGEDKRMEEQIDKLCSETGLAFVFGAMPDQEFVIGSHGIGILEPDQGAQGFLPLAHDVCVLLSPYPDRVILHTLKSEDDWLVEKMNNATVTASRQIAGRTEGLVRSLLRAA